MQVRQRFGNAGVEPAVDAQVGFVAVHELRPGAVDLRHSGVGIGPPGERPGEQQARPVAHVLSDLRFRENGAPESAEHLVHGGSEIWNAVDEGAVQIEQHRALVAAHGPASSRSRVRIAWITSP